MTSSTVPRPPHPAPAMVANGRCLERDADLIAPRVAKVLQAVDACDDLDRLRAALKVMVTAMPDLMITTEPAPAILSTTRDALEGLWP